MRAAVIQNSIGIGGRSKVISEVVKSLEQRATQIDIYTFSNSTNTARFVQHYDINQKLVDFIEYNGKYVPGTIYQQPVLNFNVKKDLMDYDLVFNSNNCLRFLPDGPVYIHYVHCPTPSISTVHEKYNKTHYRLAAIPIKIMVSMTNPNVSGHIFANSFYTRQFVNRDYNVEDVEVLYPPCLDRVQFEEFKGSGVISLGSFSPNKRQIFQLKIAREFPNTTFRIVGTKSSEEYFKKCQSYIHRHNIDNVELFTDVSDKCLENLLDKSKIFLHSMVNEKFGVAIVEGINHGCVPVIHNSGGQTEIVPDSSFRYEDFNECTSIIQNSINGNVPDIDIKSHLQQFSNENFENKITSVIEDRC